MCFEQRLSYFVFFCLICAERPALAVAVYFVRFQLDAPPVAVSPIVLQYPCQGYLVQPSSVGGLPPLGAVEAAWRCVLNALSATCVSARFPWSPFGKPETSYKTSNLRLQLI